MSLQPSYSLVTAGLLYHYKAADGPELHSTAAGRTPVLTSAVTDHNAPAPAHHPSTHKLQLRGICTFLGVLFTFSVNLDTKAELCKPILMKQRVDMSITALYIYTGYFHINTAWLTAAMSKHEPFLW